MVAPCNGRNGSGASYSEYTNYIPIGIRAVPADLTVPAAPSFNSAAVTSLARTNPGRAAVSLPVFVAELRDLPHAIRSAGNFIRQFRKPIKQSAGEFLSWQFGWAPLFSDLRKMIQFQDTVDKRVNELQRLYSNGGLKRRIRHGNWSAHSETSVITESSLGTTVATRLSHDTQVEVWSTVRWRPTRLPAAIDNVHLRKLARKAIFGMSLQAEDAWNLIPWSWLVDWFSNIGDFLEAHNNRVPSVAGPVNVMRRTRTSAHWTRTNSNWISGGTGHGTRDTLQRRVIHGGLPEADFQFLSGRQLSILGALAITRASGFRS